MTFVPFETFVFLCILSSRVAHHVTDVVVKLVGGVELLEGQMHAVTPVVTRVGGDIDKLLARVGAAEHPVGRQPILERKDTQHGR